MVSTVLILIQATTGWGVDRLPERALWAFSCLCFLVGPFIAYHRLRVRLGTENRMAVAALETYTRDPVAVHAEELLIADIDVRGRKVTAAVVLVYMAKRFPWPGLNIIGLANLIFDILEMEKPDDSDLGMGLRAWASVQALMPLHATLAIKEKDKSDEQMPSFLVTEHGIAIADLLLASGKVKRPPVVNPLQ